MSDYTENMTTEEMREEIANMIQCGEGFIATDEKLLEYVDDFISKIRADVIDEFATLCKEQIWDSEVSLDILDIDNISEQLKGAVNG